MRRKTNFSQSAKTNNTTYIQYFDRLQELALSMFEWKNLPDTIDPRFMELTLFSEGKSIFFKDDVIGFLALKCVTGGRFDVYQIPIQRRAIASNGYNKPLNAKNSVIIYNNLLHTNSVIAIENYAQRLYNLDRIIDVNANAQKTPILVICDEKQRLTMKNLYMQYDGNAPVIYADNSLNPNGVKVLTTGAPYVCDKIYTLKTQIWNEALTYLGVSNINVQKKERLITDEVTRNQGGVIASRYSRLEARREACKQINKMFGLNIWCDYREDYQVISFDDDTVDGEPNSDGEGGEQVE